MTFTQTFRFSFIIIFSFLASCKAYKQDILFQLPEEEEVLTQSIYDVGRNYIIQPNDWLEIFLFYNEGEQLINPNAVEEGRQLNNQMNQNRQRFRYLVQFDGSVKLPMIGTHFIGGLSIDQAERQLEIEYNEIYKGSFLKITFANKRVTVLGAMNAVVPIENENTSLLEVIALAGGVQFGSKAQNIRILRGDLSNPEIFEVDLTSIEGLRTSMISVHPGDVIYIEPWRRTWLQALRDVSPVIGVTSSISTLIFLLVNSFNNP